MSSDESDPAIYSPVWSPDPRAWPPRTGAEREMLTGYLDFHRATFEVKCTGVPQERLSERSIPPSSMSLHGILRHLAGVEGWWFVEQFADTDATESWPPGFPPLYSAADDPNADFDDLGGDPAEALAIWRAACQRSREIVAAAASLDESGIRRSNGETISLRWILLHMLAEYARHNGQADLLRERIDGAVGM
jgi:Protein of unknown function (DUF664)